MAATSTLLPVQSLLRAGATFYVRSAHPDAEDDYELRLAADGAYEVDYVLPDLADDAFRAVFRPEAMTGGDALLAVTQTNPYARQHDEEYAGAGRPRRYTFRQTTPAFLLSEELRALVRGRRPISLHFYDYLDQGPAVKLAFVSEAGVSSRCAFSRSVLATLLEEDDLWARPGDAVPYAPTLQEAGGLAVAPASPQARLGPAVRQGRAVTRRVPTEARAAPAASRGQASAAQMPPRGVAAPLAKLASSRAIPYYPEVVSMLDAGFRIAYRVAYLLMRVYWRVARPHTHGALVAIWSRGEILLVRNSYLRYYGIPGGYVKATETPVMAAVRELAEEVAIEVHPEDLTLGHEETHTWEGKTDTVTIFDLDVVERPAFRVDNREVIDAEFFSADYALELDLFPPLRRHIQARLAKRQA